MGEISTKSNPLSSARRKAEEVVTIPSCSPSGPIKRTSETLLISSLMRARSLSRLFETVMVQPSSLIFLLH